jgi:hypothetical protein
VANPVDHFASAFLKEQQIVPDREEHTLAE